MAFLNLRYKPSDVLRLFLLLLLSAYGLFYSLNSYAVDECNTTAQCKSLWGNTAYDCENSQSNQSVCLCEGGACSALSSVLSSPIAASGDECNTTAQCKSLWGSTANDCKNSQSEQSVCLCEGVACSTVFSNPNPTTTAPTVSFESLNNEDLLTSGSPVYVKVNGADADGQVANVRLSVDGTFIRQENVSPYEWGNRPADDILNKLSPGAHQLTAVVTDNDGLTSTASISITVVDSNTPAPPPTTPPTTASDCSITGELEQWHKVEVLCSGYSANENDDATFTDLRFNVTFTNGDTSILVPGHFAADGNAADTSASSGNKWRAYFSPPKTGNWNYSVSFRKGGNIAASTSATAGSTQSPLDGMSGAFTVAASTATGKDMRARGLLQHKSGERYLRFAGDNSVYVAGGMDSPENIFGYSEFDNTTKSSGGSCKGILHDFAAHEDDWKTGNPSWKNGKGKSLIGLVNYIASTDVNAIYIMMNTVAGDGCDAHPWTSYNSSGNVKSFDVSKLDQWERVLSHMTANGIMIHAMTQETENDQLLNGGDLGLERQLYYRELISRFGHHPALQWNLGEENTNTTAQRKSHSDYIKAADPYDHPIMMHTYPNQLDEYEGMLGHSSFDGITVQRSSISTDATGNSGTYGISVDWQAQAAAAGRPWVVSFTEASGGDAPTPNENVTSKQRVYWMWASVMSGGGGFEWYLKNDGAGHAYDLAVENLREFDEHWKQSGYLVNFFTQTLQDELGIDLQSLQRDNNATSSSSDWVLSDPGKAYVIFLREGGTTNLNLPNDDQYQVLWMNPRTGAYIEGNSLRGSGNQSIGSPPSQSTQDWVAVVSLSEESGSGLHPDIVRVLDIPQDEIVKSPAANWKDSYSVGDTCYCDSTFDHNISNILVQTDAGTITVREACELAGPGPGSAGRPVYNDIQCGNGPANDAGDEDYCPGRVDLGKAGCGQVGPTWKISDEPNTNPEAGRYVEQNGLVVIEAENTLSDFGLWARKSDISGYTGSSYIEFTGNSPINGSADSPLSYTFTVNQGGLYYLHMYVAKETLTINGETRTDVANDGYVRLDGDYSAGNNVGNNNGKDAPLSALKSDTKMFGGSNKQFAWTSGNRLDLGGEGNKRVAVYNLKAGERYTFVLSGRSQLFKVDRIVFRHESVSASAAQDTSLNETL